MASQAKNQAAAISEGLLDSLGSSDYAFPQTISEVALIAGELARTAGDNLAATKHVASGELASSIQIEDPIQDGTKVTIGVSMLFYGLFVNAGVKGTKSGKSTAGFSFKHPKPSKSMVAAISKWIKSANTATLNTGKFTYGAHESRRKDVGAAGAAYPIALAIVQKGLKPTGFFDKAIKTTSDTISERLGAKLQIDVINYLKSV